VTNPHLTNYAAPRRRHPLRSPLSRSPGHELGEHVSVHTIYRHYERQCAVGSVGAGAINRCSRACSEVRFIALLRNGRAVCRNGRPPIQPGAYSPWGPHGRVSRPAHVFSLPRPESFIRTRLIMSRYNSTPVSLIRDGRGAGGRARRNPMIRARDCTVAIWTRVCKGSGSRRLLRSTVPPPTYSCRALVSALVRAGAALLFVV